MQVGHVIAGRGERFNGISSRLCSTRIMVGAVGEWKRIRKSYSILLIIIGSCLFTYSRIGAVQLQIRKVNLQSSGHD